MEKLESFSDFISFSFNVPVVFNEIIFLCFDSL